MNRETLFQVMNSSVCAILSRVCYGFLTVKNSVEREHEKERSFYNLESDTFGTKRL